MKRFRYRLLEEEVILPELGRCRVYGVRAFDGEMPCGEVSDLSSDRAFTERLAERWTRFQLYPIHLLEAAMNAIG